MAAKLLARIRTRLVGFMYPIRRAYFVRIWGMDIGPGTRISLTAKLDKTNPRGVHIGSNTTLAFGAAVITHDFINCRRRDVHIGDNCFIGARVIILPGVRIGNNCIVSAASVVMKDVPDRSLVVGNPARVIETDIKTGVYGIRQQDIANALADPKIKSESLA